LVFSKFTLFNDLYEQKFKKLEIDFNPLDLSLTRLSEDQTENLLVFLEPLLLDGRPLPHAIRRMTHTISKKKTYI
jgi:hypothetical protein